MIKLVGEGIFNTSVGLVLRVKNDRVFSVGEIISIESDEYRIDKIIPSSNPCDFDYIGLVVSKVN